MASRHPEHQAWVVHAWCDPSGVDKTVGGWHHWAWYSTEAVALTQATRIANTYWVGRDGTKYGRYEVFPLDGMENGR
jgi:hypothetical protein